ncbi:C-type lectin domain family 4 member E-like [Pomacea canaliculata]|uniref:C-type lectin domain family 4 member E-like n=1 Tax=Pomacea canaliculata TaxID=400727 RepID=UPI000D726F71|nr:C-type lectin domain family 4 member E-like [Pomacea canaliculata]
MCWSGLTSRALVTAFFCSAIKYSVAQSLCPAGWEDFQSTCYAFGTDKVKFVDAVTFCNKHSADVVEITSEAENKFVAELVKSKGGEDVWIGISDLIQEGHWIYLRSLKEITFSKWEAHEPNNMGGKEGCALLHDDGYWNDIPCSAHFHIVCELH